MADKYLTLQTTPTGMNMIIRSLYGDKITFTKLVLGDGKPDDLDNVKALANPRVEIGIKKAETKTDYMILTGEISSANVPESFYGYELGVYATDADGTEQLYAYRYNASDIDYFPSADSGRTLELTMSIVVQLGNAENVTAILIEGEAYAKVDHTHKATDIVSGVLPVELGGTGVSSLEECGLAAVRNVTIPASEWSYSEPYTNAVSVSGMTPTQSPVISCGMPSDVSASNVKQMQKAYGMIDRAVTEEGRVTFYCYNKRPIVDINVLLKGV